ncbi:hypothetical protein ACHAWO_013036 [Cyclotella atomus]|uniref:Uncharacterized protein n=1 Tax=Cyclotella atomus TaxID=382360 RepID=A0ABD3QFS5_9STRA
MMKAKICRARKHKKDKTKKHKKKDGKISNGKDQPVNTESKMIADIVNSNESKGKILTLLAKSSKEGNTNNKSSPYQIKTIIGSAALLPTSLSSVPGKIRSLLHSLLLRYDAKLGGVLLSLEDDAKILPIDSDNKDGYHRRGGASLVGGRIIDDLPYVHYRFQVHGLVFCPKVGMKLKGQDSFSILPRWNGVERDNSSGRQIGSNNHGNGDDNDLDINDELLGPSTSIYLDDTVEFVVEKIHECGGNVMLDGTMPLVSTLD